MKNFLKQSFISGLIVCLLIGIFWWLIRTVWNLLRPLRDLLFWVFPQKVFGLEVFSVLVTILILGIAVNLIFKRTTVKRFPLIKKITDFFVRIRESSSILAQSDKIWVLIKWKPGVYSLGITTKAKLSAANKATDKNLVAVFLMTTPFIISGIVLLVEPDRLIPLAESKDILPLVVSGGLLGRREREGDE